LNNLGLVEWLKWKRAYLTTKQYKTLFRNYSIPRTSGVTQAIECLSINHPTLFFFFWWYWDLNSGFRTHKAGTLPPALKLFHS
jgi:hypothetical protein